MTERTGKRKIQRRKIHEDVTEYLLADIKNGVYKIGEELPGERALMAEFGVGRPAVREALSKLARMGLIEVRPGMRSRVCPIKTVPLFDEMTEIVKTTLQSPVGQKQMQEIRILLETAVGRSIARSATSEHIEKIERIQEDSLSVLEDPERFADMDVLFHRALGEATNNPLVVAVYDAFGKWLLTQRLNNFKLPRRTLIAHEAHGRILAALRSGDPDSVEKTVREHLGDVHKTYWSLVDRQS